MAKTLSVMHSDYIEGIKKYKIMLRFVMFSLSDTLSLIMTTLLSITAIKCFTI